MPSFQTHEIALQVQIGEVNEIFRDLAVLVSDQGAMIDTIDSNVTRAAGEVRSANTELAAAEKQQARGSGRGTRQAPPC